MRPVALVSMHCRPGPAGADGTGGMDALATALGRHLDEVSARWIGSDPGSVAADPLEELAWAHGCLLEAGGQVEDALAAGALPILLAGDGAIAMSTLPTVVRLRPEVRVLWLDAHACFHAPGTGGAPSLERMALAGACGRWPTGFAGTVPGAQLVLCGTRRIDELEREPLAALSVRVIGTTLETLVHLQHALDGAPTYVHIDADVLDEEDMPVREPVPGGLPVEKLLDLLDAVSDSCEVVGVQACGLPGGAQAPIWGERLASVMQPLLG